MVALLKKGVSISSASSALVEAGATFVRHLEFTRVLVVEGLTKEATLAVECVERVGDEVKDVVA